MNSVLLPLIDTAKKVTESLFFVDASHFIHVFHPAYVWSKKRVFIKTASGRKRHDVPGP
ncbi:MAG: hypothetical protein LBU32_07235 [Clostridiales bacterium]|nr:hypothetical protein [Clostridiales bacterium]